MCSPAVNEDWVAIKDFPFITGSEKAKEFEAVDGLGPKNLDGAEEASTSSCEKTNFAVRWIYDVNVIELIFNINGQKSCIDDNNENGKYQNNTTSSSSTFISEFPIQKLLSIHEQVCLMFPSLKGTLPPLPQLPNGIWSLISSVCIPDNFEENMVEYLQTAAEILGEKIFLESFFQQETVTEEEYLENLGELNRKAFSDAVKEAKDFLNEVLLLREGSINIHDMTSLYEIEDEAQNKLDLAEAILYNFDRQPFLDMREVAHQELKKKTNKLKNMELLEDEKTKLCEECFSWKKQLQENEANLLDLQTQFFESSMVYLIESRDRMIEDEARFNKDDFMNSSAITRLQKKRKDVCNIEIQLLRLKKTKLVSQRGKIAKELANLEDYENLEEEISKIEKKFFKKQIEIFNLDLKIVEEEENLYRMKLKEFKSEEKEDNNEDYDNEEDLFFETFEEQPVEFDEGSLGVVKTQPEKDENWKLKQEILKRLNRLFRKRAWLRTKKRKCEEDRRQKQNLKQSIEENYQWHHAIQNKRDRKKQELEEKKEFIQEMRQKTIDRLKQFKQKYPDPVIKRPPRYLPPVRRTRNGSSSSLSSEQNNKNEKNKSKVNSNGQGKKNNRSGSASEEKSKVDSNMNVKKNDDTRSDLVGPPVPPPPALPHLPPAPPPPIPPPPPAPPTLPPPPPIPPPAQTLKSSTAVQQIKNTPKKFTKDIETRAPKKNNSQNETLDLNQIISARQNLRKKTEIESNKSPDSKGTDLNSDMLSFIRSGVKLRKVDRSEAAKENGLSDIAASMLRNTLAKMNKHMTDSSDEEDGNGDEFN